MCLPFSKDVKYFFNRNEFKYVIFVVMCITFTFFYIFWGNKIHDIRETNKIKEKAEVRKLFENGTKTILVWKSCFGNPFCGIYEEYGSESFRKFGCAVRDCYITTDRNLLSVDQFDAIIFHGPDINTRRPEIPSKRSEHQRYIYLSQETPLKFPVTQKLNGFFNWTMTYRFDSDIQDYYFGVVDKNGVRVAPNKDTVWIEPDFSEKNLENLWDIYGEKKKSIAWFVTSCKNNNGRDDYVKALQNHIPVDIYGSCGPLKCPRSREKECLEMLRRDYYFYLAFENGNCLDYVTEKGPKAFNNSVIPVVLGIGDYPKYFPPHSYIDANKMSPKELASFLYSVISNRTRYIEYFWWRNYYDFALLYNHACQLCEVLHSDLPHKSYDIVKWWVGTKDDPICKPRKYFYNELNK